MHDRNVAHSPEGHSTRYWLYVKTSTGWRNVTENSKENKHDKAANVFGSEIEIIPLHGIVLLEG